MSSHNQIDERFDDLVRRLRSGRVTASPELRERVREIAAQAPEAERRVPLAERFRWRRAALVLVPACLVAAGSAALVHGLTSSGSQKRADLGFAIDRPALLRVRGAQAGVPNQGLPPGMGGFTHANAQRSAAEPAVAPPPSSRLQDYRVTMRVRLSSLDALSKATVKAMRVTRSLGGYVANVEYSSPSVRHGDAVLLLRVPIANVQTAVLAYAGLGTLVAQHFSVVDLQKLYDAEVERIGKLGFQIAKLNAQIASGSLSDVDKANAQEQLAYDRLALRRLLASKRTTLNHARLATARLSLTTFHPKKKQHVVPPPSRFDRTMDDAGRVLGRELVWALYALIVAAPFALLALLGLVGGRAVRRRGERRLLGATR